MRDAAALVIAAALMAAACGPTAPASAPAVKPAAAPAPPAAPVTAAAPAQPALTPVAQKYDTRGRRDPFESLEARAGSGPTVAAAKLTGIVRGARGPLALVETADGLGYILKPGDTLGDGRLVEIGRDSVTFSVVPKPGSTTNRVVLRLPGD